MNNYKHITLFIYSLNAGGAERVLSNIANYLVNKNYKISIVTITDEKPFYRLNDRIKLYKLGMQNKSNNFFQAIFLHLKRFTGLINILKKINSNLIISFMTINNVYATISAKVLKIPIIISERNVPYKDIKSFIWSIIYKLVYPKADFIVVQTKKIADYCSSFCKPEKIKIIPNPLNTKLFFAQSIKREQIILNIGRLYFQKGHDLLISAFSMTKIKNWKLVIIGEGPNKNKLINQIKKNNLENQVLLPGVVKNVSEYYASASIFILSSRYEGFPNVLCEAMSSGLACISFDCPAGPSEIIKHNVNGLLVENENTLKLAAAMKVLMSNNEKRRKLGSEAKKIVNKLNEDKIIQKWEKIILKLLDKK